MKCITVKRLRGCARIFIVLLPLFCFIAVTFLWIRGQFVGDHLCYAKEVRTAEQPYLTPSHICALSGNAGIELYIVRSVPGDQDWSVRGSLLSAKSGLHYSTAE